MCTDWANCAILTQRKTHFLCYFSRLFVPLQPFLRLRFMTNGIYTILLLIMSNVFMTFAWYGHLRLQQSGISTNWPLYLVIAFSWMIAFFEYCCQVPAPYRFCRQWRTLQSGTAEGDSGVYFTGGVCGDCQLYLPARGIALESCSCGPMPSGRSLLCVYETLVYGIGLLAYIVF